MATVRLASKGMVLLLLPWIGICCLLLPTVVVGGSLLPELFGMSDLTKPSQYINQGDLELTVYDISQYLIDGNSGQLYFFSGNAFQGRWEREMKTRCGKVFHSLVKKVPNVKWLVSPTGDSQGGMIDFGEALVVVRKGMEEGLLLPMGFINKKDGMTSFVIFMPSDFHFLSDVESSMTWSSDSILLIAKNVTLAANCLLQHSGVHNSISSRNIIIGEHKNKVVIYLSLLFDTASYQRQEKTGLFHMTPPNPQYQYQVVDNLYEVYTIGVMLAGLMMKDSKTTRPMIDDIPNSVVEWQKNAEWINIARFTSPNLYGESLLFGKESVSNNNDAARRLHIFCTFALIGRFPDRRGLVTRAHEYLTRHNVCDALQNDVNKYLLKYAMSLEEKNQSGRANGNQSPYWMERFNFWETLVEDKVEEIKKFIRESQERIQLLELSKTQNIRNVEDLKKLVRSEAGGMITKADDKLADVRGKQDKKKAIVNKLQGNLMYQDFLISYKQQIQKILTEPFYQQIRATRNETLKKVFTVVHTFNFLFPEFVKYITVEGFRLAVVGRVDKEGQAEYLGIINRQKTFGAGCYELLELLVQRP
eukprot:GHVS01039044.1.p1 GENE.GHVS01039044.1~~GHVS01039044.1.p1  ORF type:complete len:588 (-),score=46.77 GHVS01039044.1:102-1865(-)